MSEKPKEELLNKADELINCPDREIMAFSLGKNERHADNYSMAMTIKLRRTLEKADRTANRNFWISLALTIVLGLATIFIGIVPLFKD